MRTLLGSLAFGKAARISNDPVPHFLDAAPLAWDGAPKFK